MANRETQHAWAYHNATKHSWQSVRTGGRALDWENEPLPFKIYGGLEPLPLPEPRRSGVPALEAIADPGGAADEETRPDLPTLAALLFFAAGITRRRKYPGGEILFRAAACTGALYEFEIYLACGDLPGLDAGLYHYCPFDNALRRLRAGDWRGVLVRATAGEPAVAHAPVTLFCAGTYWRNAWKYQARTYRHFGWDNGTILANLLAEAAALRVPARLVLGFVDAEVNHLLGLDTGREVVFSLVALGHGQAAAPPAPADIPALSFETVPLSGKEVDYPLMREMHEASSLASPEETAEWRNRSLTVAALMQQSPERERAVNQAVALQSLAATAMPGDSLEDVIVRRGSTRRFAREPISLEQFSTIVDRATRGIPADFLQSSGAQLNDLYIIVNAVEGLEPGAYFFRREDRVLEQLKAGNFRRKAGYLGFDQELPAAASAAVFFLADLNSILERYGNRGYHAVQLEAGVIGGKLYLGAYAQRLGASGLTFYDDEVTAFFSPHAAGKSAIFLVALGRKEKRRVTSDE